MNKKFHIFSVLLTMISTASCADESAPTSRIRIFGQNGVTAHLSKNSACIKKPFSADSVEVSGGLKSGFVSFLRMSSNTSIGIPETETTKKLADRDGILSKAYFREYEIPAGVPSSVSLGFQDVAHSAVGADGKPYYVSGGGNCSVGLTFTPEAGEDYEAVFGLQGGACRAVIHQIRAIDGKTELIPLPVLSAPRC